MDKLDFLFKQAARIAIGLVSYFAYEMQAKVDTMDAELRELNNNFIEMHYEVKQNSEYRMENSKNDVESLKKQLSEIKNKYGII